MITIHFFLIIVCFFFIKGLGGWDFPFMLSVSKTVETRVN
jgi:hypothetical protein